MTKANAYIPVSCDLIDQIEIIATQKELAIITYLFDGKLHSQEVILKTWLTRESKEYLVLQDGTEIRLDKIFSINNQKFHDSCKY